MDRDAKQVRVVIRHINSRIDDTRFIPAVVFKKTFNAFYAALAESSKAIGQKLDNSIVIADLKIGSNEFALAHNSDSEAFSLFETCTTTVYRNDFRVALEQPLLAKRIVAMGRTYNRAFSITAIFRDGASIPIDHFFATQAANLNRALKGVMPTRYFAGSAIDTFVGILGEIDYTQTTWTGRLVISESRELECVFDKSKGEDRYNMFGNKRVSITGRSIYRGDSLLPSRLEVVEIHEIGFVERPIDIRGTLKSQDGAFGHSDLN
jgi:hypothetical protein